MLPEVQALISHFRLVRLPAEGTLFTSTYRSTHEFENGAPVGTGMIGLYCAEPLSQSLFHKLPADEIWHFYAGDPLRLVLLYPDGSSRDVIMGGHPLQGELIQFVIPAGVWQAGHVRDGGRYSLFGCTMAPGFTDDMYHGGTREALMQLYPDRADDIRRFGCGSAEISMPPGFAS